MLHKAPIFFFIYIQIKYDWIKNQMKQEQT